MESMTIILTALQEKLDSEDLSMAEKEAAEAFVRENFNTDGSLAWDLEVIED